MSNEPNIIRSQKHWRAIEGLVLGLYGMVWLRYGMDSFLIPWLWSVVFWVASVIVIVPAILNIRANHARNGLTQTDHYRRLRLVVIAANVLLIVAAFVAGQMLARNQVNMIVALTVIAGIYLVSLGAPLNWKLLFAVGAVAIVWGLVATKLFSAGNAPGGIAFGTGALLWLGSVASYDRPDPA